MKRIVFILVLSLLLGACERKKDTVIRMDFFGKYPVEIV